MSSTASNGDGNPLAPLADLSSLFAAKPPTRYTPPLPPLPGYSDDVDFEERMRSRALRKQREAQRDAAFERQRLAMVWGNALYDARRGWLARDWRQRGLADALDTSRSGELWLWMNIGGFPPRSWEPAVVEACQVPWDAALSGWRFDTLRMLREEQEANNRSASRRAGFQLVDATDDEWQSLLDASHSGRWPERTSEVKGQGPSIGLSAHMLRQELDLLALSYEAGCAAGGDDVDWVGRHRDRVQRWRIAGDQATELARIERLARQADAGRPPYPLPSYWLPPSHETRR
ncbi:hypothetical protein ACK280_25330 [Mycobacterium sherrisii]|uniref:hypothetical protein n=1 Tax=Mycobacterium sherrisii TaxID=243061 RepID=UPI0039756E48